MQEYWRALNGGQRSGLVAGVVVIVVGMAALGWWVLQDPLVAVSVGLPADRQATLAAELERAKVPYRVGSDGTTIMVPSSAAGRARAALGSGLGLPPDAGLEIFKEADFSTTDFAQRVNYQRALQGELTRTLQAMAGIQAARVHVVLPEGGLLRRNGTKASVAVTLQMVPGQTLSRPQVQGIQRLAAASVPDIKAGDVVVLDSSGRALSRGGGDADDEASSQQLDLKRQVDLYLEGKLTRLLTDLAPGGQVTLSADTALDFKQLKVTTDEPMATPAKDAERPSGVLVKERQSQRSPASGDAQAGEVADWEYEYKVGHRVEQSLSVPGAIKRISVAVAIHGAPDSLAPATVEQLVGHAVGIDRSRGDSVAVVLLPALAPVQDLAEVPASRPGAAEHAPAGASNEPLSLPTVLLAAIAVLLAVAAWGLTRPRRAGVTPEPVDVDAATAKVRAWLQQEGRV